MPTPRKRRRITKAIVTRHANQKRPQKAQEDAIVKQVYHDCEAAHNAMAAYKRIVGHRQRRLYRVDLRDGNHIWLIASEQYELYTLVIRVYLGARFVSAMGRLVDGNPIPRVETTIERIEHELNAQKEMRAKLAPSDKPVHPSFNLFVSIIDIEMELKQSFITELKLLIEHLKGIRQLSMMYYEYRNALDRIRLKIANQKAEAIAARPCIPNISDITSPDIEDLGVVDETDKDDNPRAKRAAQE